MVFIFGRKILKATFYSRNTLFSMNRKSSVSYVKPNLIIKIVANTVNLLK